jgi:magnesium transporter
MSLLRTQVHSILSSLESEISRSSLKGLLSLGRDLTGLGERAGLVNDAVERCLVDDDVLVQMDLSGKSLSAADQGGMDDIELLLESFSQRIEEVISEVQTTTVSLSTLRREYRRKLTCDCLSSRPT